MYRIYLYLRRRGFTLAEILVATVIAGYCIMPIVGSMQGGIRHTENFNHREKLRILARSRLNKELAAGAFDHAAINTETMFHHVFLDSNTNNYVTFETNAAASESIIFNDILTGSSLDVQFNDLIYSYKISVQLKENVTLATTTEDIDPTLLSSPRGLKAVVVNAELLDGPYVIATDSISYFSLLAVPSFGDQFVWLSNSTMLRILAVDSMTRSIAETFQLPLNPAELKKPADDSAHDAYRPWNIDLHPSRRLVGIQCKYDIKFLNIDKSDSDDYSKIHATASIGTSYYYSVPDKDATKAELDRGIVFRPDGKYFFVSAEKEKSLYVYSIDVATTTTPGWWPPAVKLVRNYDFKNDGESEIEDDKLSDMIAGSDGYLYLALQDKKHVIRFPMYHPTFDSSWKHERITLPVNDKKVNSVWTSKDGKYFYVLSSEERKVAQYKSYPAAKIGIAELANDSLFRDFKLSHDSCYMLLTNTDGDLLKGGLHNATVNKINFAAPTSVSTTRAAPYKHKADLIVLSPTGNEVVYTNKDKPEMYFINIDEMGQNAYTTSIPGDRILTYDSAGKSCADITTRVPEYMMVGAGTNAADSTIEFFDLHTFKFDEDRSISGLRGVPKTIGVSPQGTRFKVGFGAATGSVDAYNMIDSTFMPTSNPLTGCSKITAYSADDETVRHDSGVATYSDEFFANLEMPGDDGSTFNGYWIANSPVSSFGESDMHTDWVPQDMEAMPNGGFLMLYKKSDGSTMLDWVGKIKWGSGKGNYKRFARWISDTKTLPAVMETTAGAIDAFGGRIHLLGTSFTVGSKISFVRFNSGPWGAATRYITPVIVELNPGLTTGTIRDYASSIPATENTTNIVAATNWQLAGGVIKAANYYVGFWLGNKSGTSNAGVVKLQNVGGSFYSDYQVSSGVSLNPGDVVAGFNLGYGLEQSDRKYELQFIANSPVGGDFPPAFAQNLAISPDERFLAIECALNTNMVYLYDFATNNFGHETQLPGLIMDNRDNTDPYFNVGVPAGARFTGGGIKLRETFTANHAWTYLRTEPVNYNNSNTDSKRMFGYFQPGATVDKFYLIREDVARLFVGNSPPDELLKIWSMATTPYGPGVKQIPASTSVFIQADHRADGVGNGGIAPMYTTDSAVSTITQPSVSGSKYGTTANWQHITASETRPFNFRPALLNSWTLPGCSNDTTSAMAFSRDLANPILFVLASSSTNTNIWAFKPGMPRTKIDTGSLKNIVDKQLVISPDGQKLIFAEESGANKVYLYDIGNPDAFNFNGSDQTPTSGFGSLFTTSESLNPPPKAIAAMPYNSYKSTSRLGKYEQVATLPNLIYGNNNATLANGAIYIMGGAISEGAAPLNKIYKFEPMATPATVSTQIATLTQTTKLNSVVAYDNKIYSFNGAKTSSITDTTSWVQRYDPVTNQVISSFDPPSVGMLSPSGSPVSSDYTNKVYAYTTALGTVKVRCSRHDLGEYASKAFDGTKSGSYQWDADATCPDWIQVEFPMAVTIDEVIMYTIAGQGPKNFQIEGWDGVATTTLYTGVTTNTTGDKPFTISSPGNYLVYRIYCSTSWDSTNNDIEIPEIEMWNNTPANAGIPIMTKTVTDARAEVAASRNAACQTPYGIVVAGGYTGSATNTAIVYWPHAIDEYTDATNHSFGISRSLPPLPTRMMMHSLVWHKGKLYRIGGRPDPSSTATNIHIFDFDSNSWSADILFTNTAYFSTNATLALQKYSAAACSFGDEIFVFGGYNSSGDLQSTAFAWNPESTVVRQLGDMPVAKAGLTAVPCGSSIYLIGGTSDASVYKFTP